MNRLTLAELTSGVWALVLGVGLGSVSALVRSHPFHALGMWDKNRVEAVGHAETPLWVVALYCVCWLLLTVGPGDAVLVTS